MKVKKDDLEALTEKMAATGALTLILLAATRCPEPRVYAEVEGYLRDNEALRKNLELRPLFPAEMLSGYFSGKIEEVTKLGEKLKGKMPIGFQIPNPEANKDKMN